jgi:hypothetical protein
MTLNETQSTGSARGVFSMIAELGKDKAQEIYMSHPEAWPAAVGDVPLGLTDCPGGLSSNASWLAWKERLLSRSAAFPENQGLTAMIEQVDKALAWREQIPRHWRWWRED